MAGEVERPNGDTVNPYTKYMLSPAYMLMAAS